MPDRKVALEHGYEAIMAHVGAVYAESLGTISSEHFGRFSIACGDPNPVYRDADAARSAGYQDVIAPPLYLSSVVGWDVAPENSELLGDGRGADALAFLDLDGVRMMGAGQELEFGPPVTDGTEVTLKTSIEGVVRKQGRSGPLIVVSVIKRYVGSRGEEYVRCRETFVGH